MERRFPQVVEKFGSLPQKVSQEEFSLGLGFPTFGHLVIWSLSIFFEVLKWLGQSFPQGMFTQSVFELTRHSVYRQ